MEGLEALWIVISYNNSKLTEDAVNSIRRQNVPVRIVVWDNDSPDGSGERLANKFRPVRNVTVVQSGKNILWTPALNAAVDQYWTNEHFIGFANNDLVLPADATEKFMKLAFRPEVGMVGPTGSGFGGPQDFVSHHGPYHEADLTNLGPLRTTFLAGACVFMRKSVYDDIGPFDEDMPLGADDHDYAIRLKAKGYQIWIDESVYVEHVSHASGKSPAWNKWGSQSWKAFEKKWDNYYTTEDEALKSHWGGVYHEGYDR